MSVSLVCKFVVMFLVTVNLMAGFELLAVKFMEFVHSGLLQHEPADSNPTPAGPCILSESYEVTLLTVRGGQIQRNSEL